MSEQQTEGWGWPSGSRKTHYFVDTMALCRKYGLYCGDLEPEDMPRLEDCTACRKALVRRHTAEQREKFQQ